jgi:hypothetical protein
MSDTTITTVVPNFNHSKYLPVALGSILAQSRPCNELVVIDDSSSDGSIDVIKSIISGHANARLIANSERVGCNANMNTGLRLAKGALIHFAAADDVFGPDLYQTAVALLDAHPGAGLFSSRSDIIDGKGRPIAPAMPEFGYPLEIEGFLSATASARELIRRDSWFMGNCTVYRTALLREGGGIPEELFSLADGFVSRRLALKYGVCFSPKSHGSWRKTGSGMAESTVQNPKAASAYIAAAERRMMAEPSVFPSKYVKRWKGRQQFLLKRDRPNLSTLSRGLRLMEIAWWRLGNVAFALVLRPWDICPSVWHKIVRALHARRRVAD